jgi:hypothetical protein
MNKKKNKKQKKKQKKLTSLTLPRLDPRVPEELERTGS